MRNIRPINAYTISYAPNREDIILGSLLGDKNNGVYVDVGAGHPANSSATRFFYDRGWSGVDVTPSGRLEGLLKKYRSRDVVLNSFLSDKPSGEIVYRERLGEGDLADYTTEYKVKVTTLSEIIDSCDLSEIDFLKVNAGKKELEVLKGCDWGKVRPRIICVATDGLASVDDYARSIQYELVYSDGKNHYYADKKHYADKLPQVSRAVHGPYVVTLSVWEELNFLHQRVASLKDKIHDLEEMLEERPTNEVDSIRMRQMAKIAAKKVDLFTQGKLLPATDYENIRPQLDGEEDKGYDSRVWFSLTQKYTNAGKLHRWHPRRVGFAVYRRLKRLIKKVVKR